MTPEERFHQLEVLRSAIKACEFRANESAWWINYQRERGRAPAPWRVASYLESVRWASRWQEALAQLTDASGGAQ